MKKKVSKIFVILISSILIINFTIIVMGITNNCTFPLVNTAKAVKPVYEGWHERVLGCGFRRMSDWQAGCCQGMTSPCTDNCDKTEYCN